MKLCRAIGMTIAVMTLASGPSIAGDITSNAAVPDRPSFDIQKASIKRAGQSLVFRMDLAKQAGQATPKAIGRLKGATVYSYVWPTSFDPSTVGFGKKAGILAFAATSHPDFDDTPLYDEDGDGDPKNDGRKWHSHWVVLTKTKACGPSGLKVRDIKKGEQVDLPKTWPGLPILIDSPGWHPSFTNTSVEIRVPFEKTVKLKGIAFDGVTSALRVNANAHVPLLCVSAVFDVASGDLSLPGKID